MSDIGGDEGSRNLRGLDDIDRRILAAYKTNPQASQKEAAITAGVHYNTVSKRLKNPALSDAVTDLIGSVDEILKQAKKLAARKMKRLIFSNSETISLKACTELLKPELSAEGNAQGAPIRFVTVVNEVGVIESSPSSVLDIEAEQIPSGEKIPEP